MSKQSKMKQEYEKINKTIKQKGALYGSGIAGWYVSTLHRISKLEKE